MNIYDYQNQAWIEDGRYVRCGHPETMNCNCYGKLHAGEPATQETIEREGPPSACPRQSYVRPTLVCGHTAHTPNCDACAAWFSEQAIVLTSGDHSEYCLCRECAGNTPPVRLSLKAAINHAMRGDE